MAHWRSSCTNLFSCFIMCSLLHKFGQGLKLETVLLVDWFKLCWGISENNFLFGSLVSMSDLQSLSLDCDLNASETEPWRHIECVIRRINLGWTKYDVIDGLGVKCTACHCSSEIRKTLKEISDFSICATTAKWKKSNQGNIIKWFVAETCRGDFFLGKIRESVNICWVCQLIHSFKATANVLFACMHVIWQRVICKRGHFNHRSLLLTFSEAAIVWCLRVQFCNTVLRNTQQRTHEVRQLSCTQTAFAFLVKQLHRWSDNMS